jgi:hypothetical protein
VIDLAIITANLAHDRVAEQFAGTTKTSRGRVRRVADRLNPRAAQS